MPDLHTALISVSTTALYASTGVENQEESSLEEFTVWGSSIPIYDGYHPRALWSDVNPALTSSTILSRIQNNAWQNQFVLSPGAFNAQVKYIFNIQLLSDKGNGLAPVISIELDGVQDVSDGESFVVSGATIFGPGLAIPFGGDLSWDQSVSIGEGQARDMAYGAVTIGVFATLRWMGIGLLNTRLGGAAYATYQNSSRGAIVSAGLNGTRLATGASMVDDIVLRGYGLSSRPVIYQQHVTGASRAAKDIVRHLDDVAGK